MMYPIPLIDRVMHNAMTIEVPVAIIPAEIHRTRLIDLVIEITIKAIVKKLEMGLMNSDVAVEDVITTITTKRMIHITPKTIVTMNHVNRQEEVHLPLDHGLLRIPPNLLRNEDMIVEDGGGVVRGVDLGPALWIEGGVEDRVVVYCCEGYGIIVREKRVVDEMKDWG